MHKGIYCLIFRNPACIIRIGALGEISFNAGWHMYVGSALGSGGLKRLSRHIALAENPDRQPKWHVDYLLTNPEFRLSFAISAYTTDLLECPLVEALGGDGVPGFGCSDCGCDSHLLYRKSFPQREIVRAYRRFGLTPHIQTIMRDETKANV